MGSKNHEIVPTTLIEKIARLRAGPGGVSRSISALAKVGLIARVPGARYDGYRLTYGGLDYLALHTHAQRGDVHSVGGRVGVGKESDIIEVLGAGTPPQRCVLKIHRLGRISFRSVKTNRDYLRRRAAGSWLYLSRLSAAKEYAFLQALHAEAFSVPAPLAHSRHTVLMALIDAPPLRQVAAVPDPAALYADLIDLLLRLARHGLIHGDFNEFNILIKTVPVPAQPAQPAQHAQSEDSPPAAPPSLVPVLIDFPQMVSMDHPDAARYFDRDVACIKRFFARRFHFTSAEPGPFFPDAKLTVGQGGARRLDAVAEASGFTKQMLKDLERAVRAAPLLDQPDGNDGGDGNDGDDGAGTESDDEPDLSARSEAGGDADSEVVAASSKQGIGLDQDLAQDRMTRLVIAS